MPANAMRALSHLNMLPAHDNSGRSERPPKCRAPGSAPLKATRYAGGEDADLDRRLRRARVGSGRNAADVPPGGIMRDSSIESPFSSPVGALYYSLAESWSISAEELPIWENEMNPSRQNESRKV